VDEGEIQVQRPGYDIHSRTDEASREHHSNGSENADHPLLLGDIGQIDVQTPREQQESQHSVEDSVRKINRLNGVLGPVRSLRNKLAEECDRERSDQPDRGNADSIGQMNPAMIDVAEHRHQRDDDAGGLKQRHLHSLLFR
jgi:hypothetical protein